MWSDSESDNNPFRRISLSRHNNEKELPDSEKRSRQNFIGYA